MKFSFSSKTNPPSDSSNPAAATDDPATSEPKKQRFSLYRRFMENNRGEIREEDLKKYTGMSKSELADWAEDRPGVGRHQPCGKVDAGGGSGTGLATGEGAGLGWGYGSKDSQLKFPPTDRATEKERAMASDT